MKERDSKLEEAGDLHRFLRDLDHFQTWLTKTQTDVASEDIPGSLADAERLLNQHQAIREEIDNYTEDYTKMMDYGESVTAVRRLKTVSIVLATLICFSILSYASFIIEKLLLQLIIEFVVELKK